MPASRYSREDTSSGFELRSAWTIGERELEALADEAELGRLHALEREESRGRPELVYGSEEVLSEMLESLQDAAEIRAGADEVAGRLRGLHERTSSELVTLGDELSSVLEAREANDRLEVQELERKLGLISSRLAHVIGCGERYLEGRTREEAAAPILEELEALTSTLELGHPLDSVRETFGYRRDELTHELSELESEASTLEEVLGDD